MAVFGQGGGAVTRSKDTPELKNLSLAQKLDAILGSVTVDKAKVAGKSIVAIDDFCAQEPASGAFRDRADRPHRQSERWLLRIAERDRARSGSRR